MNEEEKERILNMHKDATKKQYLIENKSIINENIELINEQWWKKIKQFVNNLYHSPAPVIKGKGTLKKIERISQSLLKKYKDLRVVDDNNIVRIVTKGPDPQKRIKELKTQKKEFDEKIFQESMNKIGKKESSPDWQKAEQKISYYRAQISNVENEINNMKGITSTYKITNEVNLDDIQKILNKRVGEGQKLSDQDLEILQKLESGNLLKVKDKAKKDIFYDELEIDGEDFLFTNDVNGGMIKLSTGAESIVKSQKTYGLLNTRLLRSMRASLWNNVLIFGKVFLFGATPISIIIWTTPKLWNYGISNWKSIGGTPETTTKDEKLIKSCESFFRAGIKENESYLNGIVTSARNNKKNVENFKKEVMSKTTNGVVDICSCAKSFPFTKVKEVSNNRIVDGLYEVWNQFINKREFEKKQETQLEDFKQTTFDTNYAKQFGGKVSLDKNESIEFNGSQLLVWSGVENLPLDKKMELVYHQEFKLIGVVGDKKKFQDGTFCIYKYNGKDYFFGKEVNGDAVVRIIKEAEALRDNPANESRFEEVVKELERKKEELKSALGA